MSFGIFNNMRSKVVFTGAGVERQGALPACVHRHQHVWSVLIIFTEYLCQDFVSSFVRWVCEWVILFSGVKGSDGQGMTLSLWFDCSSVNSYSPPRMQPYAFLYPAPWILIQENIGHKAREEMSYPDWAGSSQILSVLKVAIIWIYFEM